MIFVVALTAMIFIPLSLFTVEKMIVLGEMETLKDYIDLSLNEVIVELDKNELSQGNLYTKERDVEKSVKEYFDKNQIPYENIDVELYETEIDFKGMIILTTIFKRHLYQSLLSNEETYEITRKFSLPVDR